MALISSVETGEELKKRRDVERKESFLGKPLHGKFFATVEKLADEGDVDLDRSWQWLKGGFLTKATEGYIMAAQEQALQTKWRKSTIEGSEDEDGLCRICGKWFETVKHIVMRKSSTGSVMTRCVLGFIGSFAESSALNVHPSGTIMSLAELAKPRMVCMNCSGTARLLAVVWSLINLIWLLLIKLIRSGQ